MKIIRILLLVTIFRWDNKNGYQIYDIQFSNLGITVANVKVFMDGKLIKAVNN